jgi:hypothetical protein
MTPHRTIQALDSCSPPRAVPKDPPLRAVPHLDFRFVNSSQHSADLLRETRDFLDAQDTSHPFQWPQWSGAQARFGTLRQAGKVRWFANCGVVYPAGRFLRSIRSLTMNRGPVCDDLELAEVGLSKLVEQARATGFSYIDIAPEWEGAFAESAAIVLARSGWQSLHNGRSSLRLQLSSSPEHLLASFRKTTRYEIRRAMSEGIKVLIACDETQYRDFLQLYEKMARQRQFPAERAEFLLSLFHWIEMDQGRGGLFLAWEQGRLRGGALVVRSGSRCWYVLGASSKDGKFGVGHLLQWRAIEWARENGCLEYDFGGYRDDVNSGPAVFKKGFCDRVVHFLPAHRYVLSPGRYRASELVSRVRRTLRFSRS